MPHKTNAPKSHLEWCVRDPQLCGPSDSPLYSAHHESRPHRLTIEGAGGFGDPSAGDRLLLSVQWVRIDSAEVDPPPAYVEGLEVLLENPDYVGRVQFHGGTDHVRNVARVLTEQADALDSWRDDQSARENRPGEAR